MSWLRAVPLQLPFFCSPGKLPSLLILRVHSDSEQQGDAPERNLTRPELCLGTCLLERRGQA